MPQTHTKTEKKVRKEKEGEILPEILYDINVNLRRFRSTIFPLTHGNKKEEAPSRTEKAELEIWLFSRHFLAKKHFSWKCLPFSILWSDSGITQVPVC